MAKVIAIGPLRSFLPLRDLLKDGFHNVLFAPSYEHALPLLRLSHYEAMILSNELAAAEVAFIIERSLEFNENAKVIALRSAMEDAAQFPALVFKADQPAEVVHALESALSEAA